MKDNGTTGPLWQVKVTYPSGRTVSGPTGPMYATLVTYDPFNDAIYWPLRNVIPYLGRMGVE